MVTAKVTSKGQLVIPAAIRRRHGIGKDTRLIVEERGEEIVLKPMSRRYFDQFAGIFKGKGSLFKELLAERARDRAREDKKWRLSSMRISDSKENRR